MPQRLPLFRCSLVHVIVLVALVAFLITACAPSLNVTVTPSSQGGVRVVEVPRERSAALLVTSDRGESFRVPPGHWPPPGQCRVWHPGMPPGHQPPPGDCGELRTRVPEGAVLLSR